MTEEVNINNLSDNDLCNVFSGLPIQDLTKIDRVCPRWAGQQLVVSRDKRRLFLFDPRASNVLQYNYRCWGISYDMFHSYRIPYMDSTNNEPYSEQFSQWLLGLFPNIEHLELGIALHIKYEDTLKFVRSLIGGWDQKLISLKVFIAVIPVQAENEYINKFWCQLIAMLNTDNCFPLLQHLTLYNSSFVWYNDIGGLLTFTNMPALRELYFGLECNVDLPQYARQIINQMNGIENLRKFGLLFDITDVDPRDNLNEQINSVSDTTGQRITDLTLLYTHYTGILDTYFDSLTTKFVNLQYLHINLRHHRIQIDDLISGLDKLKSLRHLRLSNTPVIFLPKRLVEYIQECDQEGKPIPVLESVRIFQFGYLSWDSHDNNWGRKLPFEQLRSSILRVFPRLDQVVHSHMILCEKEEFNVDELGYRPVIKPEAEQYLRTFTQMESLPTHYQILTPFTDYRDVSIINEHHQIIKHPNLATLLFLDTSNILIPATRLISLLSEMANLKYLYMKASRDYFTDLDFDSLSDVKPHASLTTLHLEQCIESVEHVPYSVIVCRKLAQTNILWPNLETIKISGLIAKLNYFDLSDNELSWLRSLSNAFVQLTTVHLLSRGENVTRKYLEVYDPFRSETTEDEQKCLRYEARFLLDNSEAACRNGDGLPKLKLNVVQGYFMAQKCSE